MKIEVGYSPGLIGRCVEMHARYYSRTVGFGFRFESRVAADMAAFVPRLDNPSNRIWFAVGQDGQVAGTLAIDGEDLGSNLAHLRWFIIEDQLRGSGMGRQLLCRALDFCDERGFAATRLWTFQGLEAARKLYEGSGFVLDEEYPGEQWGTRVMEQRFTRLGTVKDASTPPAI